MKVKSCPGRSKNFSERSQRHLKRLWVLTGEMCSKKMVQALPTWLGFYQEDDIDDEERAELLAMSSASIDRYLKSYRASLGRKKRTEPSPEKCSKTSFR